MSAGILAVVGGTAGCLGLGDDAEEVGESENEPNGNGPEDSSTGSDDRGNETDENESPDGAESNNTGADGAKEIEPDGNEPDDADGNDSKIEQSDWNTDSDDNETAEEPQENPDNNDTTTNELGDGDENDNEDDQVESEEEGDEREFEQIIIEDLSYRVDYPAGWNVIDTNEGLPVTIVNSDETAWVWINIEEAHLDLDGNITNYRQDFEPHPDIEIHEDEPMTLSSDEGAHRFVIEVSENPDNPLYAHELLANANGNRYLTSVQVSRPEYNEEYAQLAEEILASVELR